MEALIGVDPFPTADKGLEYIMLQSGPGVTELPPMEEAHSNAIEVIRVVRGSALQGLPGWGSKAC